MANTIEQNILNLNKQELDCLFKMLTENIDILTKIMPDMPLLYHIANTTTTKNSNNPIIQAYDAWKSN